jgi:hypothetical protein
MKIFGEDLSKIESHLYKNIKYTKSVFPEETKLIEFGLALMWRFTDITNETVNIQKDKPNVVANQNLFGRNRQLLLNAYYCLLSSSYGTCAVLLRTVLENNNLMRLFNKEPKYAFIWFSKERRSKFPIKIQKQYDTDVKESELKLNPFPTMKELFSENPNKNVQKDYERMYGELCNYSHPNYWGWQELMADKGEKELLLETPEFVAHNAEIAIGLTLFYTQLSFKTFVETFKTHTMVFNDLLEKWIEGYNKFIHVYKK